MVVTATSWSLAVLELLASEASEAELRDALTALAAEARTDDERATCEQLAAAALAIHGSRQEDRRRAIGLSALSDTAADLATHHELDDVLGAICHRARLLLGTDVAYVTLADTAAGDTYVRATDGIVSDAFRTMRLPTGVGIGGLVAETGRPQATPDYTADHRLAHVCDVDRRVENEGLRAIAAVPLLRSGRTIGVLLSASRVVRHFAPQELALFASLGAHAAIAIENARLHEDSRGALAELAEAHALAQAHAARLEQVGAAKERLAAVVLDGGGLQELAAVAAEFVDGRLEVTDAGGTVLATAGVHVAGAERRVHARISGAAEDLGRVELVCGPDAGIEQEVVDRVASLVAVVLLQQLVQSEAEYRHRSRLLGELLEGREIEDRARHGWLARADVIDDPHVVLVVAPPPSPTTERWAWLTAARAADAEHGIVGTVGGRVVVISPGTAAEAAAERWGELLRGAGAVRPTIGAAMSAGGLHRLSLAYRDASAALGILLAMGRAGRHATVEQLGIFGRMLSEPGRADLRQYIQRTLGTVLDQDAIGRGPLLPVLDAYFACSGHLANTARKLNVHINTLYQRLERLDKVLGDDWREPDRRLELHLAVKLRALDLRLGRQA